MSQDKRERYLEMHFSGIEVTEVDGKLHIKPRNEDPSYGQSATACWADLGRDPSGNVVKIATGGAASMVARVLNWLSNTPGGIGTGWMSNDW